MKANELRIGNYVKFPTGSVYKVDILYDDFSSLLFWMPIILNEEWLLNFGFEYLGDEFLFNNGYFDLIFNDNRVSLRVEGQWLSLEIKHVHSLQNLYFALTGCELEIK